MSKFRNHILKTLYETSGPGPVDPGILPGIFSVSLTKKVKFSKGNLQYKASTNTWRFAENQYDYVGDATNGTVYENDVKCNNELISSDYNGWIDLFGFGTSSVSGHTTIDYNFQPYNSTTTIPGNYSRANLYGTDEYGNLADRDWGQYNKIINGGNKKGLWRTLTKDEWTYLITTRSNNTTYGTKGKYLAFKCRLTVGNETNYGMMVLPDNDNTNWQTSNYGSTAWESCPLFQSIPENAVFLPCCGQRHGTSITINQGLYWSSTIRQADNDYAIYLSFVSNSINTSNYNTTVARGRGVRLVQDYEEPTELYVDLGLSVLWTTMNLGASKPQDYGDYYAWGEIEPYHADGYSTESPCTHWREMSTGAGNTDISSGYAWKTYSQGGTTTFTEWATPPYDSSTNVLLPERDAATYRLGENYRIPTVNEWTELKNNCTATWTTDYNGTGIQGYILTSNVVGYTDKHIFLPAAGYINNATHASITGTRATYMTSTRNNSTPSNINVVYIYSGYFQPTYGGSREVGRPIRAVRKKETQYVDLGLSVLWANRNIGANNPENAGNYYAFGETTIKNSYIWNTYAHGTSSTSLTKYNTRSAYGTVDNKTVLEDIDDAATVLDNETRTPLGREWTELANTNNCTWEWLTSGSYSTNIPTFKALSNGYLVISKVSGFEGNYIFLPAAGFMNNTNNPGIGTAGRYDSRNIDSTLDYDRQYTYFNDSTIGSNAKIERYYGHSIRQVKQKEGYVAFTDTTFNSAVSSVTDKVALNDSYIDFNCIGGSGYDKFYIPIYNLKVGSWYSLSFSEILTKVSSGSYNFFGSKGSYGCAVTSNSSMTTSYGDLNPFLVNSLSDNGDTAYAWANMDPWSSNAYTPSSNVSLIFKATQSTMYWRWDISKLLNDYKINFKINLTSEVKELEQPNTYYIDFVNTKYYGFTSLLSDVNEKGISTYKTDANYNEKLSFVIKTKSGTYEKYNIPICGLISGNLYTIKFTHKSSVSSISGNYDLCYGFKDTPNTTTSSGNYHNTVGYTGNIPLSKYTNFTESYTFRATAPTMYWIWSVSNINDSDSYTIEFSDIEIFEDTFTELEYISSDGQQYIDTEYQPKGTTTVGCKVTLSNLVEQGIFGAEIQNSKWYHNLVIGNSRVRDGYNTSEGVDSFNWPEFADKTVQITKTPTGTTYYAEEDGLTRTHSYSQASFTIAYNLYLFAVNRVGTVIGNNTTGQLYDFYIKENNNLIMHLKPVKRDRDGKVGMLDDVTGRFFISATGTDFYTGPVKERYKVLPGIFSVSNNKKIQFAKGNLQAEYLHGNYNWYFAEHQYDYIGNARGNNSISSPVNGDKVDFFGWSTDATNYGINVSTDSSIYSGDFKDWGNNIDNGDNWSTLSQNEWNYLVGIDSSESRKSLVKTDVTVLGISRCTIIAPDNWDLVNYPLQATYNASSTPLTWAQAEEKGLVCLPRAGYRWGSNVNVTYAQHYWSSTPNGSNQAYNIKVDGTTIEYDAPSRANGFFVRLVKEYIEPEPEPVPHYIENGVDYGEGIKIGNTIWAPVNVGTDTNNLYGKLFQWGRQYGQNGTGTCTVSAITKEQGESSGYADIFGQHNDSNSNWYDGVIDDTLWTNTVKYYDPCPEGWRLPTYEELNALYGNNTAPELIEVDGKYGCYFNGTSTASSGVFMTAGGYRDLDGEAKDVAIGGNYLTSTPNGIYVKYLEFANGTAEIKNTARAYGNSVRAVYDQTIKELPHYIEEGTDYGTGIEINGITWAPVNVGIGENYAYPYGKLYQWGRKYGCYYNDTESQTVVSGPISASTEQSNELYAVNTSPYDWLTPQDNTRYNSGDNTTPVKTLYDPCPLNWRIPTRRELTSLFGQNSSPSITNVGNIYGCYFNGTSSATDGLFLPAAGYRKNTDSTFSSKDSAGYYWTSTEYGDAVSRLFFSNGSSTMYYTTRANAISIRAIYIHPIPQDCILPGIFSISPTSTVRFSKGNLQATYNSSIYNWNFAENQYDIIGNNVANTSTITTNGTRDLFGFSTSATNYGINTSTSDGTYSGDFVDWGTNPYLKRNVGEGWSTLTKAEWQYLITTRTVTVDGVAKPSYGGGCVNTINGLILLPDNWDGSVCPDFVYGFSSYLVNSFTAEQWQDLEEAGCVFLPSAGYRSGTSVSGVVGAVESLGYYWSSTINGSSNGYDVQISTSVNPIGSIGRSIGHSVRLVIKI